MRSNPRFSPAAEQALNWLGIVGALVVGSIGLAQGVRGDAYGLAFAGIAVVVILARVTMIVIVIARRRVVGQANSISGPLNE
jgi:hypothetical protein